MAKDRVFLAVDLGAESGRVVAGLFDGEHLRMEEVHRFPNGPVEFEGHLHWDVRRLFGEVKAGIARAAQSYGEAVVSIGVDTWGVDYGLLDERGKLLTLPFHYRDRRTEGIEEKMFEKVSEEEIYEATGIQFLTINTLYQLYAEVAEESASLAQAQRLLFIPDLMNYWLTGRMASEMTIASTSQFLEARTGGWARELLKKLGIPTNLLGEIVQPGTILGPVLPEIREETGIGPVNVVAVGCHDTASAVAAVPAEGSDWAYLSSGTWSLMGVETKEPIITQRSRQYSFTNEGGIGRTFRVLKNISGLWLVQECRRTWASRAEELDYDEITRIAQEAHAFAAVIDPDQAQFSSPCDMPARIADYCRQTGQEPPDSRGSIIRTVLESLAMRYRTVLDRLEELTGRRLERLHIVGGGARNRLLNQFTASALNRPVIAGPVEATTAGNTCVQMLAGGEIASLVEGRALIRRSFETEMYKPVDTDAWNEAYERFLALERMV